jgi:hypothetical protein
MQRREFILALASTPFLLSLGCLTSGADETASISKGENTLNTPVYAPQIRDEAELLRLCAPWLELGPEGLTALVPPQGGFLFSGCPNCQGGTGDDNLAWNVALGDKIQCKYCHISLPNDQFPENGTFEFETPTKQKQLFHYHQTAAGRKYWFEGRRWFDQRTTLEQAAYHLAQLYRVNPTKYPQAAITSTAILSRFAALYPHYIIKWELPGSEKRFLPYGQSINASFGPAVGADYASRFAAWRYLEISIPLLFAYDQLAGSDVPDKDARHEIESKLFGGMIDFVENQDDLPINNMSPSLWRAQAIASNVLRRPEVTASILPGIKHILNTDFTYDGFWREGTVSYHRQTIGGIQNVVDALYPAQGDKPVAAGRDQLYPEVSRALSINNVFRLPNHHYAALNDTWGEEIYAGKPIEESNPVLLPGLGYGILAAGKAKQQWQAHLKFTGRFGHHHCDSLNLLLFAREDELVSDIGYTHTKGRPWAGSTAAHNTVVVNQQNQKEGIAPRRALGRLLLFNASNEDFQAIEAAAPEAYPELVSDYRRCLISVQAPGEVQYVVDLFHVTGGDSHDWILHGSVEENQQLALTALDGKALPRNEAASLLPAGFEFKPAESETDYLLVFNGPWAYGNFKDVSASKAQDTIKATFRSTINPSRGLQSWIVGGPASTLFATHSPTVRGIKDQEQLDKRLRTSLIVRRNGPSNQFVAVHVPFENTPAVRSVESFIWPNGGVALKIEHPAGTDFLIYQSESKLHSAKIDGQQIHFDGRVALIRKTGVGLQLKMIGGTKLQFAGETLSNTSISAPLENVQGNKLIVKGTLKAKPGEVIIVRHGDGQTSAFHVVKASKEGENTSIETLEPAVFSRGANDSLKMNFFPHLELPGPHTVAFHSQAGG